MFLAEQICEVCKTDLQFTTVAARFPEGMKQLKVCMDCKYHIEDMERREDSCNKNQK